MASGKLAAAIPLCMLVLAGGAGSSSHAASGQDASSKESVRRGAVVVPLQKAGGWDGDVRNLRWKAPKPDRVHRNQEGFPDPPLSMTNGTDTQIQTAAPLAPAPSPSSSFPGLDFANWGDGWPPDPVGSVGPVYFVQAVNTSVGIFRKSDGVRVAAFPMDSLMSQGGFGNVCDNFNEGDPTVVYDTAADRWIVSDFAWNFDANFNPVRPFYNCFAVSKTGDPVTGGWWFYSLQVDTTDSLFGDYPKMALWPDGLYQTLNMFGASFNNVRIYVFDKSRMYQGLSANAQRFEMPSIKLQGVETVFAGLPSHYHVATGAPPAGREAFITTIYDAKLARVWKLHIDWATPANSTLTGPANVALSTWSVAATTVPTPNGNSIETLREHAMMQLQYTNLGGVESLWATHTVAATTTSNTAARWYQINVTGGTVVTSGPLQQSTFDNGNDGVNRLIPSLAVDKNGDMAIGYTATNSSVFPAIRYAGRLSSDPANTLGQSETSLIEGTASQCSTATCSNNTRWGDYSAMSLDPDGCTFWYTNEYYLAPQPTTLAEDNWQTRIGSFLLPGCSAPGNLEGTVTNLGNGNPISGATVTAGSNTTTTDGSGFYLFPNIAAGSYTVTATSPGFAGPSANVTVGSGQSVIQNFALSPNLSGCLTDTSQADFQAGVATHLNLAGSPGDVQLAVSGSGQTLDQQQTTLGSSGNAITNLTWEGQSFVPGISGTLTQLDVNLFCSSCGGIAGGDITIEIRNTSGGAPGATILASTTIPGFSSGSATYYSATFSSPASLSAGTTYAYTLHGQANGGGTYAATRSNNNQYPNGAQYVSTNGGSSWSAQSTDLGFRTFMSQQTTFQTAGDLISALKDANPVPGNPTAWTTLSWTAATPAGTALKFQAAASNNSSGPFSFVGPDGTASTFFTTSGASLSQFNGFRYLKYRAFLSTTLNTVTPTLSDVTACYQNGCVGFPNGTSCNDSNACTQIDTCQSGVCTGGSPVVCTAPDACHDAGTCSPGTGLCSSGASKPDGTACEDGNACTQPDTCQSGVCQSGGLKDSDLDTHPDALCGGNDCNDADAQVWSAPSVVTNLNLTTVSPADPTWDSQSALAGPETVYDLVSGTLGPGAGVDFTLASCLQAGGPSSYPDNRSGPALGSAFWYLSRARNSCGVGTYGSPARDTAIPACP